MKNGALSMVILKMNLMIMLSNPLDGTLSSVAKSMPLLLQLAIKLKVATNMVL
jgi:hypothetical protein